MTTLPHGKKAFECKWVHKVKTNSDGSVECYKARLMTGEFDQKFGSDYNKNSCPGAGTQHLAPTSDEWETLSQSPTTAFTCTCQEEKTPYIL